MKRKLKVLTVDRKNNDGYWIAGVFDTEEEIDKYIELYLFDDENVEIEEFEYPFNALPLPNGEYAYQILIVNPEAFLIEQILAPEKFTDAPINEPTKFPLRIVVSARNAEDVKKKCLKIMSRFSKTS